MQTGKHRMDLAAELVRLEAASDYRLTTILDPGGEKKDAILEAWAHHQPRPLAWMHLDPCDNDPMRFFPCLQACLHDTGLFPTAPSLHDETSAWEDYLTEALNAAIDIPGDFFLILDDYHLISSPEIHEALGGVLDYIPDRMHLIITSRQPLPLPLPRLRLRRQLLEIDLS
jgi:LuxR family maltose regulon positive regulatory protein